MYVPEKYLLVQTLPDERRKQNSSHEHSFGAFRNQSEK